jgi:hypothetical protein
VLYAHQASVTNARTIPGEKPSRKWPKTLYIRRNIRSVLHRHRGGRI